MRTRIYETFAKALLIASSVFLASATAHALSSQCVDDYLVSINNWIVDQKPDNYLIVNRPCYHTNVGHGICVALDADLTIGGPPDDLVTVLFQFCEADYLPPVPPSAPPTVPTANACGSIIQVDARAVGEFIPIVGAPYHLVYFSNRTPGHKGNHSTYIPLTRATVSPDLLSISLQVNVAGQSFSQSFSPAPNLDFEFVWDGKDGGGQPVIGSARATVTVGNTYSSSAIDYPLVFSVPLGGYNTKVLGLGDWSLDVLHFYDPLTKRLYLGDGEIREVTARVLSSGDLLVASIDGSEAYVFSSGGQHLQTKNGLTGAILSTFSYDTSGRLVAITDSHSNQTNVLRDVSGVLTGLQGPYGQVTSITVNGDGQIATVTNPNNEMYEITYDSMTKQMQTFKKPRGQIATFTYDSNGYLTQDSNTSGRSVSLLLTPYNAITNVFRATSAEGRMTTVTVERSGSVYKRWESAPNNLSSMTTFSGTSSIETQDNFRFHRTAFTDSSRFGTMSPLTYHELVADGSSSMSIGRIESVTYTNPLNPDPFQIVSISTQTSVNSKNYQSLYTASTGIIELTSPVGRKEYVTTDSFGRLASHQKATFTPTNLLYDTNGRLSQIAQGSRTVTYSYNSQGYLSMVTNALNQTTQYQYDSAGRVTHQTLPDSRVIEHTYDANGNVVSIEPPGKPAQSFIRNLLDRIASFFAPVIGTQPVETQYSYNNDGQLTGVSLPSGRTMALTYGSTTGNLDSISTPLGNYLFSYMTGLLYAASAPVDVSNSLSHNGSRVSDDLTRYQGGYSHRVMYSYNNSFKVSQIDINDIVGNSRAASYSYDNDSLLIQAGALSITRNSHTGLVDSTTLNTITESYTYDSTYGEQATHMAVYTPSGGTPVTLYSETLARDGLGRITGKSETIDGVTSAYTYAFDSAGRLTDVTKNGSAYSHYDYDSNTNRNGGHVGGVSISASYDAQDRLASYNGLTFTYNHDGQLLTKIDTSTSQTTTYDYDVMGNLRSVALPGGTNVSYLPDAFDRRVFRKVNGTLNKRYVYDGQLRIVAELNGSGTFTSRFVYGTKSHVPDYMTKGTDTYKIVSDYLGSVRLVVKTSDGSIAQQMDYDEYGRVLTDTSPGFQPFGFAGGLYDPDTKLVRFGARDYDPETGRWTSKDPILFAGGDTNLYGYVLNDPINFIDPDGKVPVLVVAPVLGGIVGGAVGGIGAAINGGSWSDIRGGIATGAIGGAIGGLGLATGLGAAGATAAGLGASMLTALPDSGVNPSDVGKGLQQLLNPPKRSCEQ